MKKRNNSYQAQLRNKEEDTVEVKWMCMSINYHLAKCMNTSSQRLRTKHFRYLLFFHYKLNHWLLSHPDFALSSYVESTLNSSKLYVRRYFTEDC